MIYFSSFYKNVIFWKNSQICNECFSEFAVLKSSMTNINTIVIYAIFMDSNFRGESMKEE